MNALCIFVLFASVFFCPITAQSNGGVCESPQADEASGGAMTIRIERSNSGLWGTTISTNKVDDGSSNGTLVNVKRRVVMCDGQEIAVIKAVVSVPRDIYTHKFQFYRTGGKNIIVTNNGETATRLNEDIDQGFGGILTNKPLKNDEKFEVRLDKVLTKYADSLGIGITHRTPTNSDYLFWMSSGTIILYDHQLYENGNVTNQNYGSNLRFLRVGDRAGVMKKSNGDLHFYVNGVDLGVAKTDTDYQIYGVLDLYGNAVQASIV